MRTLTKSRVFVVSLNALVLAAFAMWIWCEVGIYLGENPMAELFVFVVIIPALLVFGIILLVLGRRFHIPLLNRLIPFIGVIWFFLFSVMLNGLSRFFPSLNQYLLNACLVMALSVLTIATTVSIVLSKQNGRQTGKVRWLSEEDRMSRKKSVGIVAASIIVVIAVLLISLSQYGSVGGFPDHNLGRAIRAALNKPSGAIDVSELAGLTVLYAELRGIKDLTGLDYCTNLTCLYLGGNQISDISPLANFTNLTELNLSGNQVSDISVLANFINLKEVLLADNEINDISPLASFTNFTQLDLSGNQISDISPLANLTNLRELWLADNEINDVSPLASLTDLTVLYLHANLISDISPIATLANVTCLYLGGNQISDISPLANLTSLTDLDLRDNEIGDISPLAKLTKLYYLNLDGNQISDVSCLANLTELTELGLGGNEISEVSSLADLAMLRGLWLGSNRIGDIGPLVQNEGLGTWDEVHLDGNPLSSDSVNIYIPQLEARGVSVSR